MGEDFFKDTTDEFSKGGSSSSFGSVQTERVPMIEEVFEEVLGRKPSSRELAYYKYGVLKEEAIRKKLTKSEEHKKIIEKANLLPGIESDLKNTKVSERKLQQKLEDVSSEIFESQKLLNERNILIKELRERVSNPYDFPTLSERYEEGFDMYERDRKATYIIDNRKRTFKERFIELVELLFK